MPLVVKGQDIPCDVVVHDWRKTGLAFRDLRKRLKTTKIVLHWTGGPRRPEGLYETLLDRNLSVHFGVGADGKVFQYCDAEMICAHAGKLDDGVTSANLDTIGIEIVNPATSEKDTGELQRGIDRPMIADVIHGRSIVVTGFMPAQVASAKTLVTALCGAYKLPLTCPRDKSGAVIMRALLRDAWERHRGIVGHYHATTRKIDPGGALLDELAPR